MKEADREENLMQKATALLQEPDNAPGPSQQTESPQGLSPTPAVCKALCNFLVLLLRNIKWSSKHERMEISIAIKATIFLHFTFLQLIGYCSFNLWFRLCICSLLFVFRVDCDKYFFCTGCKKSFLSESQRFIFTTKSFSK